MRASRIVAAAALLAFALGGCSPAPLPEGLTEEEVQALRSDERQQWWDAIAPGEPMPVVEVIDYVDAATSSTAVNDCINDREIDGIRISESGSITLNDPELEKVFMRVMFECAQQYPYRYEGDAADQGLYSPEQLDYLLGYFVERLVPCLRSLGYEVRAVPTVLTGPYLSWSPYDRLEPQPYTAEEWMLVDFRCPPPPFGTFSRWGEPWG